MEKGFYMQPLPPNEPQTCVSTEHAGDRSRESTCSSSTTAVGGPCPELSQTLLFLLWGGSGGSCLRRELG